MSHKPINATQIAKLAGVSRSTVSKVINNYPDIPEDTKNKVLSVIDKHKYQPNAFAQVLKGVPQTVIALYAYAYEVDMESDSLSSLESPYVMGIISNFIKAAKNHNHKLVVELIEYGDDEQEVELQIRKDFDSKTIAAAVFLGLSNDVTFIDNLINDDYRIAVLDREVKEAKSSINIFTDDSGGARLAVEHLYEQGFNSIAFIGGSDNKHSARSRLEGYTKAINKAGAEHVVFDALFSEKSGQEAAQKVLAMTSRPDSFVCSADVIAYGFIQTLREQAPDYLDQIGIVGFDNSPFNQYQRPALSSVGVDYSQIAVTTIEALLGSTETTKYTVPMSLYKRDSSFIGR
ncbi:LacI family transcriptional regulator [Vibrio kyushuensis]|uniref:LacI family DNA-binding transcriptional regulator n=1 Tax=Vibrio kyushuensis TaxID=2910249 RepID=UPI003D1476B5